MLGAIALVGAGALWLLSRKRPSSTSTPPPNNSIVAAGEVMLGDGSVGSWRVVALASGFLGQFRVPTTTPGFGGGWLDVPHGPAGLVEQARLLALEQLGLHDPVTGGPVVDWGTEPNAAQQLWDWQVRRLASGTYVGEVRPHGSGEAFSVITDPQLQPTHARLLALEAIGQS